MKNNKHIFDKVVDFIDREPKWSLFWLVMFLALSFFGFPLLIAKCNWGVEFDGSTGVIGDTIGGIVNPLIALLASFLTFIAFWVQYKANQQQKLDLQKERFENKFFEMIRLHQEYVRDLTIEGYEVLKQLHRIGDYTLGLNIKINNEGADIIKKETKGKKIFVTTYFELISCYEICKAALAFENISEKERYLIKMAYKFLYWGTGINCPKSVESKIENDELYINKALNLLNQAKKKHFDSGGADNIFSIPQSDITVKLHIKYKPFSGHASRFGQYYRHLFEAVKYVVKQDEKFIDYEQKREYLKILRGQLSDHEQLMLYYNYLSGYGSNWEDAKNPEFEFNYFSKYRMIHNINISSAQLGIDIREEFKPAIELIREQGINEGKNYEMFEQLED